MTSIRLRGLGLAVCALAAALAGAALAEDAAPQILVTVDGAPITERDVAMAAEGLRQELQQVPAQLRAAVLVDFLIDRELLATEARKGGVESKDGYKARIAYFTTQALRDAYVEEVLRPGIEDAAIQARYDEEVAKLPKVEEVRARHILVKTEEEAKAAAEEVRGGADFAEVAKARSTGPSAPKGGDLGYFTKDKMVPEFAEAAFALKIGEVSEPVETKFGWHVIKVEDRRTKQPPPLADVETSVRSMVLQDKVQSLSGSLRKAASIEFKVPGLDLSAMHGPAPVDTDGDADGDSGGATDSD